MAKSPGRDERQAAAGMKFSHCLLAVCIRKLITSYSVPVRTLPHEMKHASIKTRRVPSRIIGSGPLNRAESIYAGVGKKLVSIIGDVVDVVVVRGGGESGGGQSVEG